MVNRQNFPKTCLAKLGSLDVQVTPKGRTELKVKIYLCELGWIFNLLFLLFYVSFFWHMIKVNMISFLLNWLHSL